MFGLSCGHDVAISLSPEKRYRLMITESVRLDHVWGLWDGHSWAVLVDAKGHDCTPLWPCELCANSWKRPGLEGFRPEKMGIDCLLDRWLTVTANKKLAVAVFPVGDDTGYTISPTTMFHDLLDELDTYEHR